MGLTRDDVKYQVELRPRAEKDLRNLRRQEQSRIVEKLQLASDDLHGDIKRLVQFQPSYRLRVGDYRVLFEVEWDKIVVYRILHRREAYR
jgi:mRNA interferase RelE/StbE